MNYKQLLILRLSGTTEWKNEKEMIVPKDMMRDRPGFSFTCEFLADGAYILHGYYKGGNKYWQKDYQNNRSYKKSLGWYENGNRHWEIEYQNGQKHGIDIRWHRNGQPWWKEEWKNGEFIGHIL